jgi:hypothetical protein
MLENEPTLIRYLLKPALVGAAVAFLIAALIVLFDVAALGTLLAGSADKGLVGSLFIGGSMVKGATLGLALSLAFPLMLNRSNRQTNASQNMAELVRA